MKLMNTAERRRRLEKAAAIEKTFDAAITKAEDIGKDDFVFEVILKSNTWLPPQPPRPAADLDAALKELYSPSRIQDVLHARNPWWQNIRRSATFLTDTAVVGLSFPDPAPGCFTSHPPPCSGPRPAWRITIKPMRVTVPVPGRALYKHTHQLVNELHQAAEHALQTLALQKEKKFMESLREWIPSTAPDGDFHGLDRSIDVNRLAGQRVERDGETLINTITHAACRVAREGGKTDTTIVGRKLWAELKGITQIMGPTGPITIRLDPHLHEYECYLLDTKTWLRVALGEPRLALHRSPTTDDLLVLAKDTEELASTAPGHNAVITDDSPEHYHQPRWRA